MSTLLEPTFDWLDRNLLRSPAARLWIARHLTPGFISLLQASKFRRLVRYAARHSKFYREAFRQHGIDPKRVRCHADLGNFFTTPEDLKTHPIEDFLCAPGECGFETTGTSMGINKRVYFSYQEMFDYGRDGAAGLYNLGMRRGDVVLDGFDYSFWNAPFTAYYSLMPLRCLHVIGGFIEPQELYDRMKVYRPNVLLGVPTHMVRVTEVAEKNGAWPMKFMLLGGENLSERTRKYLESVWRGARVYLSYGQTENFGITGIECPEKGGYHVSGLSLVSEIIEPDENGYGEMAYSTLNRKVMPLIRYRSADITRWADNGTCTCGLKVMPRLDKVVGRTDELINCSMGNISPYWFEEILRDITAVSGDWQVIVRRGDRDDAIEMNLEPVNGANPQAIREQVLANIQARFPDCWRYYTKGFFALDIKFHPRHSLAGDGRKLRRLIDARRDAWNK